MSFPNDPLVFQQRSLQEIPRSLLGCCHSGSQGGAGRPGYISHFITLFLPMLYFIFFLGPGIEAGVSRRWSVGLCRSGGEKNYLYCIFQVPHNDFSQNGINCKFKINTGRMQKFCPCCFNLFQFDRRNLLVNLNLPAGSVSTDLTVNWDYLVKRYPYFSHSSFPIPPWPPTVHYAHQSLLFVFFVFNHFFLIFKHTKKHTMHLFWTEYGPGSRFIHLFVHL